MKDEMDILREVGSIAAAQTVLPDDLLAEEVLDRVGVEGERLIDGLDGLVEVAGGGVELGELAQGVDGNAAHVLLVLDQPAVVGMGEGGAADAGGGPGEERHAGREDGRRLART